jgi:hypothetical protein
MNDQDQERAVNMLLVELRLLNSRAAIFLVATGLIIGQFVGAVVYGLAVGSGASFGHAWPFGVGAGLLAFLGFLVFMPSRGSIADAIERDGG